MSLQTLPMQSASVDDRPPAYLTSMLHINHLAAMLESDLCYGRRILEPIRNMAPGKQEMLPSMS